MNDIMKIKRKVKKLLALSKSQNEAEAAAALEKAKLLMNSAGLKEYDCIEIYSEKVAFVKRRCLWRELLVSYVAYLNDTIVTKSSNGNCRFFGDEIDVFLSCEMYKYLEKTVIRITQNNVRKNAKKAYKDSYKSGIATNIAKRIEGLKKNMDGEFSETSKLLVVTQYVQKEFDLKNLPSIQNQKINQTAFAKGFAAGQYINLSKQMSNAYHQSTFMIEEK